MIRKIALTASAVALAATGLGLAGASTASAGVVVTAGTGSSLNCGLTAKAKLKPSLMDNWVKADHTGDTADGVNNIPNTSYASNGPESVSVKGTATGCTGTVTDGTNTTTVSKVAVTLVNDNPGSADPATCIALFNPTGPPSTATYKVTLKYTASPFKVTPTTITGVTIAPSSFNTSGGTITGSFAGGTSSSVGVPDATTFGIGAQELLGPAPDGTTVATSSSPAAPNVCQPGLKIKNGVATPVKPKGFKGLSIVAGSTFSISKP